VKPDRPWDVAGIGNALMDALVVLDDDALLDRLGVARGAMTLVDHQRWTQVYEEVRTRGVTFDSGGSCANTVATVGRLGARAIYYGQVGDDQMGQLYASHMERACGAHRIRSTRAAPTGKCLSIISRADAERTMLTDLGAATTLPDVGSFADDLRSAQICHFEGYTLLGGSLRDVALHGMAIAKAGGARVSLDASDPFVVLSIRDLLWELLPERVDILFLNLEEAKALSGSTDPEAAATEIAERGRVGIVAVKLGARGSLVVEHFVSSTSGRRNCVVHRIDVCPVRAIDTTGAGDAYAAGLLFGLARGWDAPRSGRLASAVAALAVAQIGAVVKDGEALGQAIAAA
jgi:sugar/nucleoside kinase (ribokinase family)